MVKKILSIALWVVTGVALIALFVFGRKAYLNHPLKGVSVNLEREHFKGFVDKEGLKTDAEAICDIAHQNKISNVDLKRIVKLLDENPWIEQGNAYIDLNDTLYISAKEYEPMLRAFDNNGSSVYVTAEGIVIPASPHYTPHLIIASGSFILPQEVNANVNKPEYLTSGIAEALIIAKALNNDDYLTRHIGQIYRNNDNAFELTVNNLPAKVIVGDIHDINDKLSRLKTLLEKYNDTEELLAYKTLDLRYKNQIVCTKK